jgi:hypothetical protein
VDQGYTGEQADEHADDNGIALHVAKLPQAKRGFAWMARFRRLAKDFERLPKTVEGLHLAVFACFMIARYSADSA